MPLNAISTYWCDWVFKAKRGDPFSFLGVGESQGGAGGMSDTKSQHGGDDDEESQHGGGNDEDEDLTKDSAPHFTIDDGILSPHLCSRIPKDRTSCLLALVTGRGAASSTFRAMVRLVDQLEVSCIEYIFFVMSDKILG